MTIRNPILPGFNPDPSICRVGDNYYIATSTFEWFPGVQIHQSKDLAVWRLVNRPLARSKQLDIVGCPASGGVWAPCITYADGLFWLIYSNVRNAKSIYKDVHNYLVTANHIEGEWSDPVYLNSSGFDPSLFHDDDGRKYLVNMVWDHRRDRNHFHGIVLQEYSPVSEKLVGRKEIIFRGTALGCTEGPHIYKRNGWYYLITAEGGTGYSHAVTLCRSKSLYRGWEVCPDNPILTSCGDRSLILQKAGHASLVEAENGKWYLTHLVSRPIGPLSRSILGRETAIQEVVWISDGWLKLKHGGNAPLLEIESPIEVVQNKPETGCFDSVKFDGEIIPSVFQSLRRPFSEDWLSLKERPGFLRLIGGESLDSLFHQSLIARRFTCLPCSVRTVVEFNPESFQQMAGLIAWYSSDSYHYLRISFDDERRCRSLNIISSDMEGAGEVLKQDIALPHSVPIYLEMVMDKDGGLNFSYSLDGTEYYQVGKTLDGTILSDEYGGKGHRFTGAFYGLCCQDLSGSRVFADFAYLTTNILKPNKH